MTWITVVQDTIQPRLTNTVYLKKAKSTPANKRKLLRTTEQPTLLTKLKLVAQTIPTIHSSPSAVWSTTTITEVSTKHIKPTLAPSNHQLVTMPTTKTWTTKASTRTSTESKILEKDIHHLDQRSRLIDRRRRQTRSLILSSTMSRMLEEASEITWTDKERQLMINIKNIWTSKRRKVKDPEAKEEERVKKILLKNIQPKSTNQAHWTKENKNKKITWILTDTQVMPISQLTCKKMMDIIQLTMLVMR